MENQKFGNIDRDNREVQNNDVRRNERNKYESNLLKEDQNVNRMHESIELFGQISNSKWFVNTR